MRRRDFAEEPDGTVRVLAPLTHHLATLTPSLRRKASPVVEQVARTLSQRAGRRGLLPTPLTRDNDSAAQAGRRRGERPDPRLVPESNRCRECGVVLNNRHRLYCDECLVVRRLGNADSLDVAHSRLRALRATGDEPTSRPDIRAKIGRNNRARQLAIREWEKRNGRSWDVEVFVREILPGLQGVTTTRMATATGLSIQYRSRIRRGLNVPHPMHWQSLADLVQ
jgi:hypothetical protein